MMGRKAMTNSFKENFNFISNIIILVLLFFGGFIYADTNGVWNRAEDVLGGTFGADEQIANMNYTFINPVYFKDKVFGTTLNISSDIYASNFIKHDGSSIGGKFVDGLNSTQAVYTNGNVGIGTNNPSYKLEVVGGSIKASGGLIVEVRNSNPPSPEIGQMWILN